MLGIKHTTGDTSGIPLKRTYADLQLIESLQADYPLFGKILHGAVMGGAWGPFDSATLQVGSAVVNCNILQ